MAFSICIDYVVSIDARGHTVLHHKNQKSLETMEYTKMDGVVSPETSWASVVIDPVVEDSVR